MSRPTYVKKLWFNSRSITGIDLHNGFLLYLKLNFKEYLEKYGYHTKESNGYSAFVRQEDLMRGEIADFQKFAGLKQTGMRKDILLGNHCLNFVLAVMARTFFSSDYYHFLLLFQTNVFFLFLFSLSLTQDWLMRKQDLNSKHQDAVTLIILNNRKSQWTLLLCCIHQFHNLWNGRNGILLTRWNIYFLCK